MSTSSTSSSLFTPLQFTGISQYSSDFQSILSRVTSIAELPVQALHNEESTIQHEQTDLTTLGSAASAVTSALQSIGQLASGQALTASSSDNNVVTATATGATSGTTYSITNVTSIATPASETSSTSYTNGTSTAVSTNGNMELVYGNQTYSISLASGQNNLTGLENAINGLGAGVTASILTTSSGDYLSLAANTTGATTLQLIDNPQNTLTSGSSGSSTVAASATSTATYPDTGTTAVSASGKMELVFGGKNYNISLTSGQNNLTGLKNAINGLSAGVTASITTTTSGQNQLSLTANASGTNTLQLLENPNNVITSANQGTNTNFDLNGIPISESTTTVNDVIPGLSLNFTGTTSSNETVSLNVATNSSQIQSALQNLVTTYNTLQTAETAQFSNGTAGSSAGSLSGNNILYQIQQAMSSIVQYQGTGSMKNLADLGIEIDNGGQMSLNTQTFDALSDSDVAASLQLLGSSTTGIGGLQQAFSAITDPVEGTIAAQQAQWTGTTTDLTDQINTKNTQIMQMEQTLDQQLQEADASVADLTSQQSVLTASIQSLDYTSYGVNTSSNSSSS